ncbi:hypothetical protein M426DRAFT_91146 [Hypoxylon sp. CI-4A]|nr:hypothetical protein M426DRAFT_91146 [Hypoxylon sp. CI-4A]
MTSNHKPVRSRFSSPMHSSSPTGHNRGLGNEGGQRTFLQKWLEPPVQNKASFQEAGLIRGGVLENMAPLGTLPKAAMYKKQVPGGGDTPPVAPVKTRIVLKKPYVATPVRESVPQTREPSVEVGDGVAIANATPMSPLSQPVVPLPAVDDGEDEDYVPKKTKVRPSQIGTPSNNTRRSSTRRRSARPSPSPMPSSPTHNPTPLSPPRFHPPTSTLNREPDKDHADKVVEAAVDEALRHYRYPTAWALRILYDDNSSDPHFVSMIEDIYYQRADTETLKEFNRLICDKKKDGKKDNKGCYYFVPPSTGSRFTPHKPKPAPYGDLVKMDLSPFNELGVKDDDGHVSKKMRLDDNEESTMNMDLEDTTMDTTMDMTMDVTMEGDTNGVADESNPAEANGSSGGNGDVGPTATTKTPRKSPKKAKARSGSVSSSSSLSSVPNDEPDDYEEFMDQVDGDLGITRPLAAEPDAAQIPADSSQPISGQQQKPAAKKNGAATKDTPSHNTPTSHPPSRDSSMPAAAVAASTPQPTKSHALFGIKFESKFKKLDDPFSTKKEDKKSETVSATKGVSDDSFTRNPLPSDDHSVVELAVAPPPLPEPSASRSSRTPALSSRAARAAKRNQDDLDDSISPTALSFRAAEEPYSTRNSRAATPTSNQRSVKKPRAGLRVKTSPMKKKGTSAGIPRGNGDRPSPTGNGASNNQDDNDDTCFTCGGNGELVCCDGCNYSFHLLCIDPPLTEGHMPDEWYCNECKHRLAPPFVEHRGAFRSLLSDLHQKNPTAFRLPKDVREMFEDVRTGPEGEYEDIPPPKPKTNKKNVEEPFDFFKLRNADGPVLCHQCQKGTSDNSPMLPCSVCKLNWHLECLDPPLTIPPVPRTWRCPCHVDEMLSEIPERLAPAHRYRKIKEAPPIEQAYTRGMPNNGWIEVVNDDDREKESVDAGGWRTYQNFGRVHRLSEKGIKLDFISRVHNDRATRGLTPVPQLPRRIPTLDEQQAALNLARVAQGNGDGLDLLHRAMVSEASPGMISMMASGDSERISTGNLNSVDTISLEAMLAQTESMQKSIRHILRNRTEPAAGVAKQGSLLSGEQSSANEAATDTSTINGSKPAADDSAMQID